MHQMQETSALWGLLISKRCHGNKQSSFPLSLDFILDPDNMKQHETNGGGGDTHAQTGDGTSCLLS